MYTTEKFNASYTFLTLLCLNTVVRGPMVVSLPLVQSENYQHPGSKGEALEAKHNVKAIALSFPLSDKRQLVREYK